MTDQTPTPESDTTLSEPERELLSSLCDVEATRGAGHDAYCYAHHSPVKWAGHANASEVCCLAVEDYVEQVLALRLTTVLPSAESHVVSDMNWRVAATPHDPGATRPLSPGSDGGVS